jgi:hypothetical protein
MKAELADQEKTSIAMQRHGKHVPAVKNNHAAREEIE